MEFIKNKGSIPPPKHMLNAPTLFSCQNYFPEDLEGGSIYYNLLKKGFEPEMKKRMSYWENLKAKNRVYDKFTKI